jgi:2-polyprenyl-3-methyl-5-hydroxy-6-metoxy-1,4-benzoquinol methylase
VFLFDCDDADLLRQLVERVPRSSLERIEEIVIVVDGSQEAPSPDPRAISTAPPPLVRVHRTPGRSGYGAARKVAFEYALRSDFDQIVVMRGDGQHPPERLEDLMDAASEHPRSLIIASRLSDPRRARRDGMSLPRIITLWLARGLQNAVLGLRVQDYQSSFRLYPGSALRRIPWQLNSDARSFDDELLIQLRALGAQTVEVPAHPVWLEYGRSSGLLERVFRSLQAAFGYRFHQLHLTRRHLYMVDQDTHYTLKSSPTSSHSQIVEAIAPGSRVLDLGCSQGLLARPLAEKNVRVTGVDSRPPEQLADELETYYQRDLERELELPEGRDFEYVVIADVIEHLRNRRQLLRSARRFLKEDGRLIISTPNIAIWFYRLSLLVGRFEYGPRGVLDETHVHLYTRQTFQREVERAGFRVIRRRVTSLPFEVVFQATGKSRIVRWMATAYYGLARAWPSMFAYQHILEAQIITLDEDGTSS